MPREIAWLPGASRDVGRLRNLIKSRNSHTAERAAKRIYREETNRIVIVRVRHSKEEGF